MTTALISTLPSTPSYSQYQPLAGSTLSVVSIVRSAAARAEEIQYDEIKSMVENAVEMAGGFEGLIEDGNTVVIKPNLVTMRDNTLPNWNGRPTSPEANGNSTDWRIAKAVVELVRVYNPSGKVYVMEGSAGNTREAMLHLKYTSEYIPGVDEFVPIEEDSGVWHDYDSDGLVRVDLPNGLLHKEYYLNRKYREADVLISLPCLKDHWHAAVTGAVKNVGIGATPGNIYGIAPGVPGRNNMVDHESIDLHKWIHDFFLARPADFAIMDGLQGIQNGPTPCFEISGTDDIKKDQKNMRLILASKDSVALDTIEALVMNWDPDAVKYLEYLGMSEAGNNNIAKIVVAGKQVDEVRTDFEGVIPKAGGRKVTELTVPETSVRSYEVKDGTLLVSLKTDTDTVKVEIYIDGKLSLLHNSNDLSGLAVDLTGAGMGENAGIEEHEVKIWTFDRFLNRAENILKLNDYSVYLC